MFPLPPSPLRRLSAALSHFAVWSTTKNTVEAKKAHLACFFSLVCALLKPQRAQCLDCGSRTRHRCVLRLLLSLLLSLGTTTNYAGRRRRRRRRRRREIRRRGSRKIKRDPRGCVRLAIIAPSTRLPFSSSSSPSPSPPFHWFSTLLLPPPPPDYLHHSLTEAISSSPAFSFLTSGASRRPS